MKENIMASVRKNKESVPSTKERVAGGAGAIASVITPIQQLTRMSLACMLWEDAAYESGVKITDKIKEVVAQCEPVDVAGLAMKCRNEMNLRHVGLLLTRELARHPRRHEQPSLVASTLESIIQRPDEIAEFLAIYWKDGKTPIAKQVKKGLSAALNKFNEYSIAKYFGDRKDISIRDVMFLVHAKPNDIEDGFKWDKDARHIHGDVPRDPALTKKESLFKKITDRNLETPDTWETNLSTGGDKKEVFERLMQEGKLGGLAFLRNLRNMNNAGVDSGLIEQYAMSVNVDRILPFRFITAYKQLPGFKSTLEKMMFRCLEGSKKLKGRTVLVLDISGSMYSPLSTKSDMSRYDAAVALAILMREVCEDIVIYATAGNDCKRVHATDTLPHDVRGLSMNEEIRHMTDKLGYGGIFLTQVCDYVAKREIDVVADRVFILTDEQDVDTKCNPDNAVPFGKRNYIINVSSNTNGIAYGKWTHITGWSENVIDYVIELEEMEIN